MVYGYTPSNDPGLKKIAKRFNPGGKAARARKTPKKGSSANPVSRMGLGSIYDKITVDNTSLGTPRSTGSAGRSTGAPRVRSYSRGGGGGGGYSGPTAAQLAAQAAAAAAAFRQGIINQYVSPTNKLYDTAKQAADSDIIRSTQAFDQANHEQAAYARQIQEQANNRQRRRAAAVRDTARRMGLDGEISLMRNVAKVAAPAADVVKRNNEYTKTLADDAYGAYQVQKRNAANRTRAYQDELDRQRKLQLDQIAQTYGIKL